ncbi:MAG: DNA polymerase III subunit gamma/tau [Fuerstiella sp.]|nr:DNA polymerase III subunit gamma/tau [Fuerstiella sp.]
MSSGSHYTVLARRFRPQTFSDVVGQEHVSRALQNAIRSERVAHAYLFTGARGVGKTSIARILAKALNCPDVQDGVPCNNCEICEGISAGSDVDIMEIDGASNRRIEDIRSIRSNVGVRSMRTRFKVYIIDEVHMLTREAFNALLKTLEEPPPNVKFVFCTTEPEKVPDTILSRCQRFDFGTIEDNTIGERLKEIARSEGFEVADDAIELIARRARGSMRDSQSLFDQLLAFSEGTVQVSDVHRMLGTAGDDLLIQLFENVTDQRPGEVLNVLEQALTAGVQPGEMLDQCVGYVRDMMVILSGGATVPLCSVRDDSRTVVAEQARRATLQNVMAAFQILAEARSRMMRSTFARVLLEMALVQISLLEDLSAISRLLSGNLPELPAASSIETSDSVEKKTTDLSGSSESQQSPPEKSTPKVRFHTDSSDELLSQLVAFTPFTVSAALKATERIAISEPNTVELIVNSSLEFQKKVLETPEHRSTIQQLIEQFTGVQAVISIRSVQVAASVAKVPPSETGGSLSNRSASSETDQPEAPMVRNDIDPRMDAFVQEVADVFGARVDRVINAPTKRRAE